MIVFDLTSELVQKKYFTFLLNLTSNLGIQYIIKWNKLVQLIVYKIFTDDLVDITFMCISGHLVLGCMGFSGCYIQQVPSCVLSFPWMMEYT